MVSMNFCKDLAESLNEFIKQAADRTFDKIKRRNSKDCNGPVWYDHECRELRSEAIKAGEPASTEYDFQNLINKSKAYKACKQRKIRQFRRCIMTKIENANKEGHGNIWNVLKHNSPAVHGRNMPCPDEFFALLKNHSPPRDATYFEYEYQKSAFAFLNEYDAGALPRTYSTGVKLELLNDNFTDSEIIMTIESLRNNTSPGLDSLPSEFIKLCKQELVELITTAMIIWLNAEASPIFRQKVYVRLCLKRDV